MRNKGTYIKAWFLLAVFSLNTVVGFACSQIGLFHSSHHQEKPSSSSCHDSSEENDEESENCCSGATVSFEKLEKWASRTIDPPQNSFITLFYSYTTLAPEFSAFQEDLDFPLYRRWRPSVTIPDLRIVMQSFQI